VIDTSRLHRAVAAVIAVCLLHLSQSVLADAEPAPRIFVTGEGSVELAPDMAIVNLSVMREAPTARAALAANTEAMRKVLDALAALGIEKRDLQTANFAIQPRYTYPPQPATGAPQAPKLVGYTVRNALTVRVRDLAKLGEVLDTSVTLGVNEGGSIQFTNDDPSAAINQARVKATKDAMAKARTLADAAGVKLGKVLEISEQNYGPPRPMAMAKMEMAMDSAAAPVPIAAGENSYSVTVNLSVAIAQ
jgi:uncharacterized protein YggE